MPIEPTAFNPDRSFVAGPAAGPRPLSMEERFRRLENVFHSAPVGLCFIDLEFRYITVNECFAAMYGHRCEHFPGRTVREALPAVADQIMAHLEQSLRTESLVSIELQLTRSTADYPESRSFVYLRTAQPMRDAGNAIIGFSVALTDITERKAAEAALRESEENFRYTVELNPHVPWTVESGGTLVSLGPGFTVLTGLPRQVSVEEWSNIIHMEDRPALVAAWLRSLETGVPFDYTYRMQCRDAQFRWMRSRAFPRRNPGGDIIRWYGTLEDIHERTLLDEALRNKTARLEEVSSQLALLVREDHLTGLANRRHFDDAFEREMVRARRSRQPLSLIMLDVDFFKRYNDTFGHPAGDICLRDVGQALKKSLRRQGDLAARYGGEEFIILLPDTSEDGAMEVARFVNRAVGELHLHHPASATGFLTVSGGVASFDPDQDLAHRNACNNLLQAADLALYAAKTAGRNRTISSRALNEFAPLPHGICA